MTAQNPISPKTVAATSGAAGGTILASLANWILGVVFWDVPTSAERAADAVAAVPTPIAGAIALLTPVLGAALFGWRTDDPLRVTPEQFQSMAPAPQVK